MYAYCNSINYTYKNHLFICFYQNTNIYQTKHHNGRGPQKPHVFSHISGFSKPLASKPPRVLRSSGRKTASLGFSGSALTHSAVGKREIVLAKEGCYSKARPKKASDFVTLSIFTLIFAIIFHICGTTCIAQLLPEKACFQS